MPPKSNKRKLATENDVDQQDPSKKVHLDVSDNNSRLSTTVSESTNDNGLELDVAEQKNEMDVEKPLDDGNIVVDEAQVESLAASAMEDGVLDLRPTYRQAIQDEVHRMKGMDYSTAVVQRDVWLPPEVMIAIMLSLSRTTVAIMTRVCKEWNKLGKRKELSWLVLYRGLLRNYYGTHSFTYQIHSQGNSNTPCGFMYDEKMKAGWGRTAAKGMFRLQFPGLSYGYQPFALQEGDLTTVPSRCFQGKNLFDIDYKQSFHSEGANEFEQYWITIFTNPREFENIILKRHRERKNNPQEEPANRFPPLPKVNANSHLIPASLAEQEEAIDEIWNYLLKETEETSLRSCSLLEQKSRKPQTPLMFSHLPQQPEGLIPKLHPYQLRALAWLKTQETRNRHEAIQVSYCPYVPWFAGQSDLLFNPEEKKVIELKDVPDNTYHVTMDSSVSILADEMGLGKTLEVIGLILSNPAPSEFYSEKSDEGEGALEDLDGAPRDADGYIKIGATLVFCPNHLAAQWKEEVEKHTNPNLQVVLLTTKNDLDKISYASILSADIVVVSYQFLKNPNYFFLPQNKKGTPKLSDCASRLERIDRARTDIKPNAKVILEHFLWYRLVLDEGHEVAGNAFNLAMIMGIKSVHKIYVSGTPFPNPETMQGVVDFCGVRSDDPLALPYEDRYCETTLTPMAINRAWIFCDLLFNNFFWRQTKESTREDCELPGLLEDVVFIDFTEFEMQLYNEAKTNSTKLEICCHPCISSSDAGGISFSGSNDETLGYLSIRRGYENTIEAKQKSIVDYNHLITQHKSDAKETQKNIDRYEAQRPGNNPVEQERHARLLANARATLKRHEEFLAQAAIDSVVKAKNLELWKGLKSSIPSADSAKSPQTRPVKEGDNADKEMHVESPQPALMKKPSLIKRKSSFSMSQEAKRLEREKSVSRYCSKIGTMVYYLKTLLAKEETRVIIFSQYSNFLSLLTTILEVEGIESTSVEGNIQRKQKALKAFKNDGSTSRVIMLSLSKAASGTNLMEATHVMLLDPMTGTKEEAFALEQQAIGRAYRQGQTRQVTVVRFVIRNTLEETLHFRNNTTENKPSTAPSKANLVRSTSMATQLTNSPALQRKESFLNYLAEESKL